MQPEPLPQGTSVGGTFNWRLAAAAEGVKKEPGAGDRPGHRKRSRPLGQGPLGQVGSEVSEALRAVRGSTAAALHPGAQCRQRPRRARACGLGGGLTAEGAGQGHEGARAASAAP